ncbi:MAG: TraR/DksA family transcriptional regulator [Acidobacteriaceae bacterium]|nr:TraR/DksA family transcriptional regulator [Acidobacteriaceae bacterium]
MKHISPPKCDLSKYRAILEGRVADLERNIRAREGIAVERTPDAVDEVQRASERALAISHMDRQSKQLQDTRAALRRIDEGTFGVCEDCEKEIPSKRLWAVPWASLCVVCQEAQDRLSLHAFGSIGLLEAA